MKIIPRKFSNKVLKQYQKIRKTKKETMYKIKVKNFLCTINKNKKNAFPSCLGTIKK